MSAAKADAPSEKSNLPGLTGLRFIAAFMVLLAHGTGTIMQFQDSPAWSPFWTCTAHMAMCLFFVLSGFVIHYNYCDLFRTKPASTALWTFASARFARLYPMFVFCFLLGCAFVPVVSMLPNHLFIAPLFLTFTQSWIYLPVSEGQTATLVFFPHAWSISTEFGFYLLFPLVVFPIGRLRRPIAALIVFFAFMFFALKGVIALSKDTITPYDWYTLWTGGYTQIPSVFTSWMQYFSPLVRFLEFCTGCLAAQLFRTLMHRPVGRIEKTTGILGILLSVAGLFYLTRELTYDPTLKTLHQISLNYLFAPFFAIVVFCTARYPSVLTKWLDKPSIVMLGELSYSIYLLHLFFLSPFVYAGSQPLNGYTVTELVLRMLMYISVTCLASYASYRAIEVPGRRWLRKALGRLSWLTVGRARPYLVPLAVYGIPCLGMIVGVVVYRKYQLPAAYYSRGVAHYAKGELTAAIADYSAAIEQNERFVDAWLHRGIARQANNDALNALGDFKRAFALDSNDPNTLEQLATVNTLITGDYDLAIAELTKLAKLKTASPTVYYLRARVYRMKGLFELSLADLAKAIALNSKDPAYYSERGDLFVALGNRDAALEDFTRVASLQPGFHAALSARASLRAERGDLFGALSDYERAIESNPGDADCRSRRDALLIRVKDQLAKDSEIRH